MINVTKLDLELRAAGLPVSGVSYDPFVGQLAIDWERPITPQEETLAESITAAHDPTDYQAQRQVDAVRRAKLVTELATITGDQAAAYIDSQVTDLASARRVLKIMARLILALRDEVWPELRGQVPDPTIEVKP